MLLSHIHTHNVYSFSAFSIPMSSVPCSSLSLSHTLILQLLSRLLKDGKPAGNAQAAARRSSRIERSLKRQLYLLGILDQDESDAAQADGAGYSSVSGIADKNVTNGKLASATSSAAAAAAPTRSTRSRASPANGSAAGGAAEPASEPPDEVLAALQQTIDDLRAENERAHGLLLQLRSSVKPAVLRREARRLEQEKAVEALDEQIEDTYQKWLGHVRRKEVSAEL